MIGVYYLHLFVGNAFVGWLAGLLETMPGTQFWGLHAALVAVRGRAAARMPCAVRQRARRRRGAKGHDTGPATVAGLISRALANRRAAADDRTHESDRSLLESPTAPPARTRGRAPHDGLAASRRCMRADFEWLADADRHHRLGAHRRHRRRALGEGRPPGDVLVARPEELKALVGEARPARARRHAWNEAIDFGDVVFLAVPYGAMPQIGRDYGAASTGKVVLDAGNAVAVARRRDRRRGRAERHRRHLAEIPAGRAPGARVQHAGQHVLAREASRAEAAARDSRSRATTMRRCRSRPRSCATPASIRWSSASSPTRAASSAATRATARS